MDDLKVTITYLGQRKRTPLARPNEEPWPHHAYTIALELNGTTMDFPLSVGTGWKREPEEWLAEIRWAPDYITVATVASDPHSGAPRFGKAVRERFYKERDEELRKGALQSFAMDLEMDEFNSDDDLAADLELRPSQIREIRAQCQRLRDLLGNRVQEFIDEYRGE